MTKRDIVVTWPKSRALRSYLRELERARLNGRVINFRVPHEPRPKPERCYLVYDGHVIGYNEVIDVKYRHEGEVRRVDDLGFWPAGWYIVRHPEFHSCGARRAMKGFQGWRWFDRAACESGTEA